MSDWSHGYNVSLGYTYGFYRELAPDLLDFCAQISGYAAPSRSAGGAFRYLELGSGQGLGLCLLAAANPDGEFVGVDFNPEHIAHANALVEAGGLTNIRFVEGDFDAMARAWPADFGQFDYTVLHGIYSWVPPEVRRAIVACLDAALVPGGLVYTSYNTKPGWLPTAPFQHLARRLQMVTNKPGPAVIDDAVALFEKLADSNTAMSRALPGLKSRVDSIKTQNRNYLVQEYLHQNWHPLWFSEVAEEMAGAKLGYIGSATVAELLLPGVLPEAMRDLVTSQSDPVLSQEILDCVINQSFRRDIFCRGARRTFQHRHQAAMSAVFHLVGRPETMPLKIPTTYGELSLNEGFVGNIFDALETGAKTLEEILLLPPVAASSVNVGIQAVLLLLQAGVINIGRKAARADAAQVFNKALVRAVTQGAPYGHLAVPALGSALPASDIDCMLIDTYLELGKADSKLLVAGLKARLARLNRSLSHNGERLEGAALEERMDKLADDFANVHLKRWQRLQAVAQS